MKIFFLIFFKISCLRKIIFLPLDWVSYVFFLSLRFLLEVWWFIPLNIPEPMRSSTVKENHIGSARRLARSFGVHTDRQTNIQRSCYLIMRIFLITGMDILKHGEAAYPAQAWIEEQYRKRQQSMYDRKPSHMQGPGITVQLNQL